MRIFSFIRLHNQLQPAKAGNEAKEKRREEKRRQNKTRHTQVFRLLGLRFQAVVDPSFVAWGTSIRDLKGFVCHESLAFVIC